ncbi:NAD(P)-dependent oxidoreductase [Nocardia brasiliensis]|uniref:NAD(P)-dependent oxidoreductase n=1 Tax=Nocardia brasiliensis TaxID=37326 RepID=UPI0024572FB7|nr:NAD(P)-binding domain-containing protein [Nocardia brasiliensis]
MTTHQVGFIGLGKMGAALAGRLLDAGYDVTVWSRTAGKADELLARGATLADRPEDAIATGTVFSMLSNEEAVRQVFTADRIRSAPAGFVHINHATISPAAAREFAAAGGDYLSAPVIGRPEAVVAGQLAVLISGEEDVRAAGAPMDAALGRGGGGRARPRCLSGACGPPPPRRHRCSPRSAGGCGTSAPPWTPHQR